MELAHGVFDLPVTIESDQGERTFHPSGAALADEGVMLFDVCFAHTLDQLDDGLAEHGYGLDDVRHVLLTHQDGDHAGGLAALRERLDHPVTTFAHEGDAPAIDGREAPFKGEGDRYPASRVDVELVGGETFQTAAGEMHVVATPGHTPGHLSLYFPDAGVLLAADATVAEDGELAGPNEVFTPEMDRALASLASLSELAFTDVLCYHGGHVEAGPDDVRALTE